MYYIILYYIILYYIIMGVKFRQQYKTIKLSRQN